MKDINSILGEVYDPAPKEESTKSQAQEQAKAFLAAAKLNDLESIEWLKNFIENEKMTISTQSNIVLDLAMEATDDKACRTIINRMIYIAARRDVLKELTSIETNL